MRVPLPNGITIEVDTNDPQEAQRIAANVYQRKFSVDRIPQGAAFGAEEASVMGDIGRGAVSGLVSAIEGVSTLPALATDLLADTNHAEKVADFYDKLKPATYTNAGTAAKFITQFAVPGTLAAKLARARKLKKPGEIAALAGTDFAVATQDVETLGDFFDIGPLKTTELEDLDGLERASAALGNRLKIAGEGAALILGIPAALKATAAGVGKASDAIASTEAIKKAAQLRTNPNSPFYKAPGKVDLENPGSIRKTANYLKKKLTFQGELPDRTVAELKALQAIEANVINHKMNRSMTEMDDALKILSRSGASDVEDHAVLEALNNALWSPVESQRKNWLNSLKSFDDKIDKLSFREKGLTRIGLPKLRTSKVSLFESARAFREQIDELSKSLINNKEFQLLDPELQGQLIKQIEGQVGYYGTRAYRMLKDPSYVPSPEQTRAAVNELTGLTNRAGNPITREEAVNILEQMSDRKNFQSARMNASMQFDEDVLRGVTQGVLKGRRLDTLPAVRDFLGEYTGDTEVLAHIQLPGGGYKKGPSRGVHFLTATERREGLLSKIRETVESQSKILTKAQYFRRLEKYNSTLPAEQQFLKNFDEVGEQAAITKEWTRIGGTGPGDAARYGSLDGKWAKTEFVRAFQDTPSQLLDSSLGRLYATFLGMKGISQMAKTVYSPITQIRNATTASFFALANGNFGKGKTLIDSAETVFSELANVHRQVPGSTGTRTAADAATQYDEYMDLGVVNTNVRQGEFEDLIKDADMYMNPGIAKYGGRKAINWFQDRRNTFANKLYQGSDDVWKIYSYEMERGRLADVFARNPNTKIPVTDAKNILEFGADVNPAALTEPQLEIFLKREAASIVRDTVPNYVRVPEFIRQLRKAPLGNFIAFPAEIIRTSGNILGRSLKELANEAPEIRSIGMRRLLGFTAVQGGIGGGLYTAGVALTGTDTDQVEAYKRSFAAPWDRNSQLIPVASDKTGKPTEYYNFSYTNPYDYLRRPFAGILNAYQGGMREEKDLDAVAMDMGSEFLREMFSPFASESIITEKTLDVVRNQTNFGRPIYDEGDPLGLKWAKGFAHFVEGLTPGILPVELSASGGASAYLDMEFRDFPKAVGMAFGADPVLGVKRSGEKIDPAGAMMEAFSGVKTIKPRVEKTLYYRGLEAANQVREATRILNSLARRSDVVDPEELTRAYIRSNEQRFKALRDLSISIDDARILGVRDTEIATQLKKANTPQYRAVMNKTFIPFFPSTATMVEAQREARNKISNPFYMPDIYQHQAQQFQRRFPSPSMPLPRGMSSLPPATPSPTFMPAAPATTAAPPSLFQPQPGRAAQALRQMELNKLFGIQ